MNFQLCTAKMDWILRWYRCKRRYKCDRSDRILYELDTNWIWFCLKLNIICSWEWNEHRLTGSDPKCCLNGFVHNFELIACSSINFLCTFSHHFILWIDSSFAWIDRNTKHSYDCCTNSMHFDMTFNSKTIKIYPQFGESVCQISKLTAMECHFKRSKLYCKSNNSQSAANTI